LLSFPTPDAFPLLDSYDVDVVTVLGVTFSGMLVPVLANTIVVVLVVAVLLVDDFPRLPSNPTTSPAFFTKQFLSWSKMPAPDELPEAELADTELPEPLKSDLPTLSRAPRWGFGRVKARLKKIGAIINIWVITNYILKPAIYVNIRTRRFFVF
jgi:hypothetical protein